MVVIDVDDAKVIRTGLAPDGATAVDLNNAEPLLDAERLEDEFLWGIQLVSGMPDPETGEPKRMLPRHLKRYIQRAVAIAQEEMGLAIFQEHHLEVLPYDRTDQASFGYLTVAHPPITRVESLSIVSSDNVKVWSVPTAWLADGQFLDGQINVVPFAVVGASGATVPFADSGGMGLLPTILRQPWVASLWQVEYDTGWRDGKFPVIVNELIGSIAAMEALEALAATYARSTSSSLSLDGLSQSTSGGGPEQFNNKLKQLGEKRAWIERKLQRKFGLGIVTGDV